MKWVFDGFTINKEYVICIQVMEMLCWIKQSKGTKSKETCYFIWGVQIKLSDNVYL